MSISENLSRIQQQIEQISAEYQRENVRLLAVSKTKPVQAIEEAIRADQWLKKSPIFQAINRWNGILSDRYNRIKAVWWLSILTGFKPWIVSKLPSV